MTNLGLSPKGRARRIRDKWLHPGTNWIVDLTNDIEEQVRTAVEEALEGAAQRVEAYKMSLLVKKKVADAIRRKKP